MPIVVIYWDRKLQGAMEISCVMASAVGILGRYRNPGTEDDGIFMGGSSIFGTAIPIYVIMATYLLGDDGNVGEGGVGR
jgi:hypothetical protein